MPATVHKNKDGSYRVETPNGIHARSTTKKKAEAQARLLNAIDHGFVPTKGKGKIHHKDFKKTKGYK